MQVFAPCVALLCWFQLAQSARILGVFPHIGKSHFDVFEPLLKRLAERGHDVLVISHFPQRSPLRNYTDISVKGSVLDFAPVGQIKMDETYGASTLNQARMLSTLAIGSCELVLNHPNVQDLMRSEQKFDLVITELFNTDCFLGFVHKYRAPHVALSSSTLLPWANARFGNPDNPSYIPNLFEPFSDHMSFWERFQNVAFYLLHHALYEVMYNGPCEKIARRVFGESLPPLEEIAKNTSLVLVNSHFTLNKPRAAVPAVVEVGGIHLPTPGRLPQELQQWLDEAPHGVIYFNMGSMIRAASFDPARRDALVQAFSELPQRVLWKWEGSVPHKPDNVRTVEWLPQFEVLNHPNVRVFIAHGGLLGTIEAAYAGVPMVGIPVFGDQKMNIQKVVSMGMGLHLDYAHISKQSALRVLRELLDNPRYRDKAKQVSLAYRDRPIKPMDEAVFWVEYVIRHRGAPLLKSAAVDLNIFQYLLLDVILVALVGVLVAAFGVYLLFSRLRGDPGQKLKSH